MAQFSCKLESDAATFRRDFQTQGLVCCKRRLVCEELTACLCNFVGHFQNRVGRKINCEGRNWDNIG